jgi:hypothetical protein
VAEFLSDAWITALDAALQASTAVRELVPLVIEQVVRDVPGRGDVRYRVWVDSAGGHAALNAPNGAPPDIRFSTDYTTATAIARGRDNAQRALASGRLQLGGRVDVLARHAAALAALDDVATRLRADTSYRDDERRSP